MYELHEKAHERLKTLSVCYFAFAGFNALGGCVGLVISALIIPNAIAPSPQSSSLEGRYDDSMFVAAVVGLGLGILLNLTAVVLSILTGRKLPQWEKYTFCKVSAVLHCLQVPFGTVLGVLTLVILNKPETRQLFGVEPMPAAAPRDEASTAHTHPTHRESTRQHIRILSTFYYLSSAISAVGVCVGVGIIVFGAWSTSVMIDFSDTSSQHRESSFLIGGSIMAIGLTMLLVSATLGVLALLAARRLPEFRSYALCRWAAVIHLLMFPVGTTLGICTLVILNKRETKQLFGVEPQDVSEVDDVSPPSPIVAR